MSEPLALTKLKELYPQLDWDYKIQSDNLAEQYRLYQGAMPPIYIQVSEQFDRFTGSIWINKQRIYFKKAIKLKTVLKGLNDQGMVFQKITDILKQNTQPNETCLTTVSTEI